MWSLLGEACWGGACVTNLFLQAVLNKISSLDEDIASYLGFLVLALATLSFQHLSHNVTTNQSHNFAFISTTAILIYSIIWCFKWRENFNNFFPPMKCNILLYFRLGYPLFHRILTEVKAKVTSVIMHLFPHQPPLSEKEGAYTWTPNWYHCDPTPLPLCTKREPHRGEQIITWLQMLLKKLYQFLFEQCQPHLRRYTKEKWYLLIVIIELSNFWCNFSYLPSFKVIPNIQNRSRKTKIQFYMVMFQKKILNTEFSLNIFFFGWFLPIDMKPTLMSTFNWLGVKKKKTKLKLLNKLYWLLLIAALYHKIRPIIHSCESKVVA